MMMNDEIGILETMCLCENFFFSLVLVSLFKGILTFVGYLIPKESLLKNSS